MVCLQRTEGLLALANEWYATFKRAECAEKEAAAETEECIPLHDLRFLIGRTENLHGGWMREFREQLVHHLEFVLQSALLRDLVNLHIANFQTPDPLVRRPL